MKTLQQLSRNESAKIAGFSDELTQTSRLMAMGVLPGQSIEVLHRAPFGDPIQIKCNNSLTSIRSKIAALILVDTTP